MAYIEPTMRVINLAPEHVVCTSIKISDEEVDASESFANQKDFSSSFDELDQKW